MKWPQNYPNCWVNVTVSATRAKSLSFCMKLSSFKMNLCQGTRKIAARRHFRGYDKYTHIIGNGEFMSTGLVTGIQTCCWTQEAEGKRGREGRGHKIEFGTQSFRVLILYLVTPAFVFWPRSHGSHLPLMSLSWRDDVILLCPYCFHFLFLINQQLSRLMVTIQRKNIIITS